MYLIYTQYSPYLNHVKPKAICFIQYVLYNIILLYNMCIIKYVYYITCIIQCLLYNMFYTICTYMCTSSR